jgi:hypothetical protein
VSAVCAVMVVAKLQSPSTVVYTIELITQLLSFRQGERSGRAKLRLSRGFQGCPGLRRHPQKSVRWPTGHGVRSHAVTRGSRQGIAKRSGRGNFVGISIARQDDAGSLGSGGASPYPELRPEPDLVAAAKRRKYENEYDWGA